jgi:hypothetical protein
MKNLTQIASAFVLKAKEEFGYAPVGFTAAVVAIADVLPKNLHRPRSADDDLGDIFGWRDERRFLTA